MTATQLTGIGILVIIFGIFIWGITFNNHGRWSLQRSRNTAMAGSYVCGLGILIMFMAFLLWGTGILKPY